MCYLWTIINNMNNISTYKIVIIGDSGVGKSTFVVQQFGIFQPLHFPTLGVNIDPLNINTSVGPVILNIWDCAGDERFYGLKEKYYYGANAIIIMFDVTSQKSFENINKWYNLAVQTVGKNVPIFICGNKMDKDMHVKNNGIHPITKRFHYNISVKSGKNVSEFLLNVIRKLKNNPSIVLTENESTLMDDIDHESQIDPIIIEDNTVGSKMNPIIIEDDIDGSIKNPIIIDDIMQEYYIEPVMMSDNIQKDTIKELSSDKGILSYLFSFIY